MILKYYILFVLFFIDFFLLNSSKSAFCTSQKTQDLLEEKTFLTIIQAEKGLEWQKGGERLIARGNVHVHRGHIALHTDVLMISSYEIKTPTVLSWWQALGNTHVVFPMGTISGETADYDVQGHILSLGGHPVHLETKTATVTANKSIEYREKNQIIVVRGDVHLVTQEGYILHMNLATIHLKNGIKAPQKSMHLFGETIRLETHTEVFCGQYGKYSLDTGIAVVMSSVKASTDSMQLFSKRAVMNMKNGLSRLYIVLPIAKRQQIITERQEQGMRKRVKLQLLQKNSQKTY